jgi:Zn finger protein HypA/HybF involved in hydrogenase expression
VQAGFATLVQHPNKIICLGLNYATHIAEMGRPIPAYPTLFAKYDGAFIGASDDIHMSAVSDALDWIAFTGSSATGKHVHGLASADLRYLTLELGGKSPGIICADADLEAPAKGAAASFCLGTGQACVATSRILVQESVRQEFVDLLTKAMAAFTSGDLVEMVPAAVWCPVCKAEREIDEYYALRCPQCANPTANLVRGREFEVAYVELEVAAHR